MVQEDDVLPPRATEPPLLSALHAKNDTTIGVRAIFCQGGR